MRVQITLRSDRAERFEEIREEIAEELGYDPSYAETTGIIMSQWDSTDPPLIESR